MFFVRNEMRNEMASIGAVRCLLNSILHTSVGVRPCTPWSPRTVGLCRFRRGHAGKSVAWAEVGAAQSELDAAANEIDPKLPARD